MRNSKSERFLPRGASQCMGEAGEDCRQRRSSRRGQGDCRGHQELWQPSTAAACAVAGAWRRRGRQFFRCLWEVFSSVRDNKAESSSECVCKSDTCAVGVGASLVKEMRHRSRGGVESLLSQIPRGELFGNCVDVNVYPPGKEPCALGSG